MPTLILLTTVDGREGAQRLAFFAAGEEKFDRVIGLSMDSFPPSPSEWEEISEAIRRIHEDAVRRDRFKRQ